MPNLSQIKRQRMMAFLDTLHSMICTGDLSVVRITVSISTPQKNRTYTKRNNEW